MIPDSLRLAVLLTVSLLMSLMMIVSTFVGMPVGRWVDRAGYLKPTLIGLGGVVAGEVLAALVPSLAGGGQMVLPFAFGAFGAALGMLPMFWVAATVLGAGGGFAVTRQRLR